MNAEQNFAEGLREMGDAHAEMAETSESIALQTHRLLDMGDDVDDIPVNLEKEMEEMLQDMESESDRHGDYARFFYGMARLFESGDWKYTDLKMVHGMMEA